MKIEALRTLPEAFGPKVLAEKLGISDASAYRFCEQNNLSVRIGGRIVVFRDPLLEVLISQTA